MGRPRNAEKRAADQEAFLAAFARTGIAKTAAAEAGFKPVQHYRWLKDDPQYAARFAGLEAQTRELAKANRKPCPRGYEIEGPRGERKRQAQERFLGALAASGIVMEAAAAAGVSAASFYVWCRKSPEFRERARSVLRDAEDRRREIVTERVGAGSRAAWADPERRRAWGEHQRQAWTPEMREAAAERNLSRMADPAYRERWLAASRKSREFAACGNPGYFDVIDIPEKAYWLGFLVTDGMVTGFKSGSLRLTVKLARKDRSHLEILHRTLQAKRPIRDREEWSKPPGTTERKKRPVSVLDVCSPQLVNALVTQGVKPRKTDIVEPWDGPAGLMPHYWRGVMDGDGTLGTYDGEVRVGLCGSRPLTEAFLAWARDVCGTTANVRQGTQGNRRYCTLAIGGNNRAPRLLAALYDDAPVALARKKAEADLIVHGKPFSPILF
jgi:hypothetical protein